MILARKLKKVHWGKYGRQIVQNEKPLQGVSKTGIDKKVQFWLTDYFNLQFCHFLDPEDL